MTGTSLDRPLDPVRICASEELVDGGDGQTFPRFAAAYPHAVATVLRALAQTTGVDVTALLTPVGVGGASDAGARATEGGAA